MGNESQPLTVGSRVVTHDSCLATVLRVAPDWITVRCDGLDEGSVHDYQPSQLVAVESPCYGCGDCAHCTARRARAERRERAMGEVVA